MKKIVLLIVLCLITALYSCREKTIEADAWGNFEVTEIMVSSESSGRIISLNAPEGRVVEKGSIIAITDTIMLNLQREELSATMKTITAKVNALKSQNNIINQQIANLDVNINRTLKMVEDQAATRKQLDDLTGQRAVLETQLNANNAQAAAVDAEKKVLEARSHQLNEQISRCIIKAPSAGTIMERYAEEGEVTAPGKPLARLADLTTMNLKVYVSGSQLGFAAPGSICRVRVDEGTKSYRWYEGTILTVSSKAEFTPKIIQTREERVNLVYAVTIEVKNDGFIRNGMPGEAIFREKAEQND